MNESGKGIIYLIKDKRYWNGIFVIWISSFFILPNSSSVSILFYCMIALPSLFLISQVEISKYQNIDAKKLLLPLMIVILLASSLHHDLIKQIKHIGIIILFYFSVSRLDVSNLKNIWAIAWFFLAMAFAYILINMILKNQINEYSLGQRLVHLSGKISNPIFVTDFMAIMLATITALSLKLQKYRTLMLAHFFVLLFSLLVLQSRSIIPIWGAILGLILLNIKVVNNQYKYTIVGLFLLLAFVMTLILINTNTGAAIIQRGDSYRLEIWNAYILATYDCGIVIGCGNLHTFQYIAKDGLQISHAHNIFIAYFFKYGLIGLISLLSVVIWAIYFGLKTIPWAAWMLIAGAVGLSFDGNNILKNPNETWLIFHLPLAIILAVYIKALRSDDCSLCAGAR